MMALQQHLDFAHEHRIMGNILPFPKSERVQSMSLRELPVDVETLPAEKRDDAVRWAQLMVDAQKGDRVSYHSLLTEITPYLRAMAKRYLGHRDDAEDAIQEILITVHDIRHTYEPGRPFKPWLSTIAARRCIDLLRRRTRRLDSETDSDSHFDFDVDDADTPEDAAARKQSHQVLRAAIEVLPSKQKEAIHLLHLKELSLSEASEGNPQSAGALKVACHRAIKALERALVGKE
ncbi:MAG: sigma-70 family RNA polymerase sigma factor [Arenimonas sp.]